MMFLPRSLGVPIALRPKSMIVICIPFCWYNAQRLDISGSHLCYFDLSSQISSPNIFKDSFS